MVKTIQYSFYIDIELVTLMQLQQVARSADITERHVNKEGHANEISFNGHVNIIIHNDIYNYGMVS